MLHNCKIIFTQRHVHVVVTISVGLKLYRAIARIKLKYQTPTGAPVYCNLMKPTVDSLRAFDMVALLSEDLGGDRESSWNTRVLSILKVLERVPFNNDASGILISANY